jgi:hypothetical protein
MTSIIIFFGLITFLSGSIILVNPEIIFGPLRKNSEKLWIQILAVGVRVVIGFLLILYAADSRFPMVIVILGWLSIGAAFVFAVMGRRRFLSLMSRAFSLSERFGRVGGLMAMAFGAFLVYSFL